MSDPKKDLIKDKLDDPAIEIECFRKTDAGYYEVDVSFSGTELNLVRMVNSEFDVGLTMKQDDQSVYATLTPKFGAF